MNERVDLSDSEIYTIEEIVDSVSKTANYLNLQSNMLSQLSPNLILFTKLTVLDMSHNQLVSIHFISLLENLQTLGIANNRLTSDAIDEANLQDLQNLQKINLNGNEIEEFPKSLCLIKQLTHLGLADNMIEVIPHEITDLFYLCFLSLKNNRIATCDVDFSKLVLLRGVSFVGNPTDARASSRLFPNVPLMQYGESASDSSLSLSNVEGDQVA